MEYVPSISSRMLANNSSGLIGVALGFMKKGNASSFEDPFVSAMLGNLEYQIREHGYYTVSYTHLSLTASARKKKKHRSSREITILLQQTW